MTSDYAASPESILGTVWTAEAQVDGSVALAKGGSMLGPSHWRPLPE